MKRARNLLLFIAAMLVAPAWLASCGEDRWAGYAEQTKTDRWIDDTMRVWYYWREDIPGTNDLNYFTDPITFFRSLLSPQDGKGGTPYSTIDTLQAVTRSIPYTERLVVTGEAFIRSSDFAVLKDTLLDSSGKPYKNARNLASGSIRLLDSDVCRKRRLNFQAFSVLEGFEQYPLKSDRLRMIQPFGFQICRYLKTNAPLSLKWLKKGIEQLQSDAMEMDVPIDGIVVTFNDVAYSKSCGQTGHHYKDGMAFKFEDDAFESQLQYIEWNPARSGEITPVAIFDTVEIDGCEVSRASLHNLSFVEKLELMPGNRIKVSKRNMIIPHIEENLDRGGFDMDKLIPHTCPCCGEPTRIHMTESVVEGEKRITKTLHCDNPGCETRRLRQFVHFVSQKAMDIEGLSEATLEKFIGRGFLHRAIWISTGWTGTGRRS